MRTDEARSARQFDDEADIYASRYGDPDPSGHSFRARRDLCLEMVGERELGAVLDIGGASAIYFEALRSRASSYWLADISYEMVARARREGGDERGPYCAVASVYTLPYADQGFDRVLAMCLFEYLDEPWRALAELRRVVRPGGELLISFTNAHSPMRRLSALLYRCFRRPRPFGRLFTIQEARREAARLGLEERAVRGYNAQLVPFPLTWRLAGLAYRQAAACEPLLRRGGRFWGTSFIVCYRRPSAC